MRSRAKAWALASPHAGALLESTDWSATPLGAVPTWPDSLRQAASICLSSRLPMFVWWGQALTGLYNDAYIPLLGQRHPAAFGRPAQQVWADIWDVIGPQTEQVMRQGTSTWNERVRLVTQRNGDAEEAWFTWSYSPIFDEDGGVGGLFCACTEDTAQVLAERERDALLQAARQESIEHALVERRLRESEQRFRSATLMASSIVWTNDASGRMVGEQPGWQGFTGQSLDACQGYGWSDAVHPEDGPATVTAWNEAVARQGEFRHRHRVRRADGQYRVCDIRAVPLLDERHVLREWVGVHTDITERLAFDQQLQHSLAAEQIARGEAEHANRMKDEFLATLSHELRTPLSAILGWVALLRRRGALPEDIERGVTVIERNARAQTQIIADLLDMSAIVSGKVTLELSTIDLQTFVALAVETMRPTAVAQGIAIAFTLDALDASASPAVMADTNRLQQILWNLLSNAVKFTPTGGHIEVSLALQGQHAVLQVRDDGEGIAPDFMAHIFDRFRQADASTTRSRGGLGLGLSIVKKLAELHEGTIEAHSPGLGQGSVFTLRLPLSNPLEMAGSFSRLSADFSSSVVAHGSASAPLRVAPGEAALRGLRVLLVDDDVDGREATQSLLEHQHVAVTPAGSTAEAMACLDRSAFDAVISDIGMPEVDGYGFMRQLRALETRRQAARVAAIALTAFARPEDQAKAIDAGFDLHLAKPVDAARLYEALASVAAGATTHAGRVL